MVTGDSANDLFGISLDPNVLIQESKVGTCDVLRRTSSHGSDAAARSSRATSAAPACTTTTSVPIVSRTGRDRPRTDDRRRRRPPDNPLEDP